jgi:hypothetical protein
LNSLNFVISGPVAGSLNSNTEVSASVCCIAALYVALHQIQLLFTK